MAKIGVFYKKRYEAQQVALEAFLGAKQVAHEAFLEAEHEACAWRESKHSLYGDGENKLIATLLLGIEHLGGTQGKFEILYYLYMLGFLNQYTLRY